jgi:EAL domain-containing protein (putative c-di-GMP-specific phosphodiesterase class I)
VEPDDVRRSRILAVDDDLSMRRFIEKVLTNPSRTVDTATNGEQALALMSRNSYEVILTDIAMPGMSGLDFLRAVRQTDPDVPVVLVTGSPALETAIEAVEHGAFRYLLKPVDIADMQAVVDRATRLHAISRLRRSALETRAHDTPATADRESLARSFESGLRSLYMLYQPIVSSRQRCVFGYEALVRSGEAALLTPTDLLAAAERLSRVRDLGRAVRSAVATDAKRAPDGTVFFVNIHAEELEDESLYASDGPLTPLAKRVVLEITERASLEGIRDVPARIARLRSMGFRLAVDDLGAAYSGLSTLARIEPEIVKLDMFLARGLAGRSANRAVVKSMVQLCLELGMAFVCEGVETDEQRDAMIDLGCDLFQGYLYSRPRRSFELVDGIKFGEASS